MAKSNNQLQIKHIPLMIDDTSVNVHVMHLHESAMLWVNSNDIQMSNLAVAMKTNFDNQCTALNLLGDKSATLPSNLAQRLSKRTGKQIYISYNLPETDNELLTKVERHLLQELLD